MRTWSTFTPTPAERVRRVGRLGKCLHSEPLGTLWATYHTGKRQKHQYKRRDELKNISVDKVVRFLRGKAEVVEGEFKGR